MLYDSFLLTCTYPPLKRPMTGCIPCSGMFMADDSDRLHQFNPGAGAQCEGELVRQSGGGGTVRR